MSAVIGVMGESGSGKTTAMRNLPMGETVYLDCDKKGLRDALEEYIQTMWGKTPEGWL